MPNYNKVQLIGNLSREVELKYSTTGIAIAELVVAVSETYKEGDSQKEYTNFIEVTAFGKRAEILAEFGGKGDPIFIEGKLRIDKWLDKATNQPRQKLVVIADTSQFLGDGGKKRKALPTPPDLEL